MERASRVIKQSKNSNRILTDDDFARAIWPIAVGKTIAAHTLRVKLVRAKLVVEVEDAIWQRQLFPLTMQIVSRIRQVTGSNTVEDIEFRIGIPRRQAARVELPEHKRNPLFHDEADTIQDPVLQKVYRISRKRASA